jgi:hypothetical protein
VFFLNPDLRHWLPGAHFVPYASVDPRELRQVPPPDGDELVVAHAPTDRDVKGTGHVIAAVEALRHEGVSVRLDLIEDMTHGEALSRLAAADLVVDQLVLGWYGAVAVEAMALGRPVLAYIRENESEDNPFGSKLPIVRTTAGTLAADLRALAVDRVARHALAAAGRRFVEEEHDPRRIARTVLDDLVRIPDEAATSASRQRLSARAPR